VDLDRQNFGREPVAVTHRARHFPEVFRPALTSAVGLGLRVLTFDVRHHALEARGVAHLPPVPIAPAHVDGEVLAVQNSVLHPLRQRTPRRVQRKPQIGSQPLQQTLVVLVQTLALRAPGHNDALPERSVVVTQQQLHVDRHPRPQARAGRAGSERRVERERPGLDLGEVLSMPIRACHPFAEAQPRRIPFDVHQLNADHAVGQAQRCLDRVRDAWQDVGTRHQPVHHDRDVVSPALGQARRVGELDLVAVHNGASESFRGQFAEQVDELALLPCHHGGDDLVAGPLRKLHQLVCDLLHGLPLNHRPALWAVRSSDPRPQQPHVVVDLGDRSYGRPRIAIRGLLVDRHSGAEPLDEIDVRSVDLTEELTSIGTERLDVPALTLREDRVECEARFARTGQPGEDDHRVARDFQIDVPEVVHPRAPDADFPGVLAEHGDGHDGH